MKNGCRGISSLYGDDNSSKNMDYMSCNEVSMQFIKRRMLQMLRKPVWIHPQMEGGGGVGALM